MTNDGGAIMNEFQSTPPARGATRSDVAGVAVLYNFNPRPPRGGRPLQTNFYGQAVYISIHAPREGGDDLRAAARRPVGISIHAPREGGDRVPSFSTVSRMSFQSTPPARGATTSRRYNICSYRFQSTPPARGATLPRRHWARCRGISIHAPREGGDSKDAQFYLRIFDK